MNNELNMPVVSSQVVSWEDIPKNPTAILISGKIGVGKTTMAEMMVKFLNSRNMDALKLSFATPIKFIAEDILEWNGEKDEKGRRLLQKLGSAGREFNEDVWVKLLYYTIEEHLIYAQYYVIDDWRFPNEAKYLIDKGVNVFTIRIERDQSALPTPLAKDVSETSLDMQYPYDVIYYNVSTLQDLEQGSTDILKQLLKLGG